MSNVDKKNVQQNLQNHKMLLFICCPLLNLIQVVFLLHAVLVIGLISDGLGVYSITGAFFLGVVVPKGTLNNAVQDKVFDFVSVFMMPHFFVMIGFRTKIHEWALDTHWMTIVIVVVLAFMVKMVCIYGVSWVYQMPPKEGLSLALLMNTKGTMPLIILYTARDRLVSYPTTLTYSKYTNH